LFNNHNVYVLREKGTNKVRYVGRTVDLKGTEYRHNQNPARANLNFDPVARNISKETARGLEELLIIGYYNTLNRNDPMYSQIHGVSLKNPKRDMYMKLAYTWVSENEIKLD